MRGVLFQLFYACLSFLPRPSLPKWFPKLACSSGPTGELVCLFKKNLFMYFNFLAFYYRHFQTYTKGERDHSQMNVTCSHLGSTSHPHFVQILLSIFPHFFALFWVFKTKFQSPYHFTHRNSYIYLTDKDFLKKKKQKT